MKTIQSFFIVFAVCMAYNNCVAMQSQSAKSKSGAKATKIFFTINGSQVTLRALTTDDLQNTQTISTLYRKYAKQFQKPTDSEQNRYQIFLTMLTDYANAFNKRTALCYKVIPHINEEYNCDNSIYQEVDGLVFATPDGRVAGFGYNMASKASQEALELVQAECCRFFAHAQERKIHKYTDPQKLIDELVLLKAPAMTTKKK